MTRPLDLVARANGNLLSPWHSVHGCASRGSDRFSRSAGLAAGRLRVLAAYAFGWISALVLCWVLADLPVDVFLPAACSAIGLFSVSGLLYARLVGKGGLPDREQEGNPKGEEPTIEHRCASLSREFGLTPRQQEICLLVCEGRAIPDIADELYISKDTVKTHIKAIYAKTEVHSRQEFLALAYSQEVKP